MTSTTKYHNTNYPNVGALRRRLCRGELLQRTDIKLLLQKNCQPPAAPRQLRSTSALSSLSAWNHAINPRLFSGDVSPTSTSSELANALTPCKPSTPVSVPTSAILPNQIATDHNKHHYHDRSASQRQSSHLQVSHTSVANRRDDNDSNDNDEEQQVIEVCSCESVMGLILEMPSDEKIQERQ